MTDQEELYSRQMEERWQQIQQALAQGATYEELQPLYAAYVQAADDYDKAAGVYDATQRHDATEHQSC